MLNSKEIRDCYISIDELIQEMESDNGANVPDEATVTCFTSNEELEEVEVFVGSLTIEETSIMAAGEVSEQEALVEKYGEVAKKTSEFLEELFNQM